MEFHSTIIEFDIAQHTFKELKMHELVNAYNKNKIYWIHCDLNQPDCLKEIIPKINLPEKIITLCEQLDSIPKLIDDSESLTIQIECLLLQESTEDVIFGDVIFYLTDNFCFTAAQGFIPAIDNFKAGYQKSLKYAKTPCFILFLILDNAINDFSKVLLDYELIADQMDLKIRDVDTNIYKEVMDIKKQVMKLQHHIAAIRDVLMRISGRKISVISEQCRLSLGNLLDHTQIIFNEAEAIRDILRSTLDQIDNALIQKLNNTMRVLTAFAAIFLPVSLIAGIYGMNFDWIPELHWRFGYFWALGLMLGCGLLLYFLFRKMKWF